MPTDSVSGSLASRTVPGRALQKQGVACAVYNVQINQPDLPFTKAPAERSQTLDNLYANVPRDLTRVKSKLFLNLTRRQILCFGAAILVGLPLFFLLRKTGNMTLAAMTMILVMLPFFFLAMYERNGQPLEVILRHFITARFKRPKIRTYQTENTFRKAVRNRRISDKSRHAREKKQKTNANTAEKETAENTTNTPAGRKEKPHARKKEKD